MHFVDTKATEGSVGVKVFPEHGRALAFYRMAASELPNKARDLAYSQDPCAEYVGGHEV